MKKKYFKNEIPGKNTMFLSQKGEFFIKIVLYEEKASIELLKGIEWLSILNFTECSQEEFDKAYTQAYSQIHTKFLSLKTQTRDELIRNIQIAND